MSGPGCFCPGYITVRVMFVRVAKKWKRDNIISDRSAIDKKRRERNMNQRLWYWDWDNGKIRSTIGIWHHNWWWWEVKNGKIVHPCSLLESVYCICSIQSNIGSKAGQCGAISWLCDTTVQSYRLTDLSRNFTWNGFHLIKIIEISQLKALSKTYTKIVNTALLLFF